MQPARMESEALKHYFKKTYDEYADAIFRFCLMKTSNKEQAEDLVQETFMRLWQSLRDGKEMQNVRAYLYTIANNLVTDWYRKRKPESLTALEEKGFEAKDVTSETPLREAEHAEVLRLVEQLDEGDRAVLLMRFIEGIEPREIAEMLGESANVISVRIHRALKRVRQSIEPNTEI